MVLVGVALKLLPLMTIARRDAFAPLNTCLCNIRSNARYISPPPGNCYAVEMCFRQIKSEGGLIFRFCPLHNTNMDEMPVSQVSEHNLPMRLVVGMALALNVIESRFCSKAGNAFDNQYF